MLTLAYIALAVLGCGYIVVAGFLGHLFEFGDAGHAGHVHAGDLGGHVGHAGHVGHGDDQAGGHAVTYGLGGTGHGTAESAAPGPGEFHFPFFSPLAIATLFAALGAFGIIAKSGFGATDAASLAVALPAAFATAYGVSYLGWRLVQGARASSLIRLADLRGAPAEVTTPIPAGGLGEAVASVGAQRYAGPAREVTGREVPRGTAVTVVEISGPTLVVRAGTARQEGSGSA